MLGRKSTCEEKKHVQRKAAQVVKNQCAQEEATCVKKKHCGQRRSRHVPGEGGTVGGMLTRSSSVPGEEAVANAEEMQQQAWLKTAACGEK